MSVIYMNSYQFAVAAPLSSDPFPPAYRSIIDSFIGTKYYVDAATGSDSNAGTSEQAAFATINKATTTAGHDCMIIVKPGSYTNIQNALGASNFASCVIGDYNKRLQIVCAPGQVRISSLPSNRRDMWAVELYNPASKLYGAIIERDSGTRTLNYSTALFGWTDGELHNCVLRATNSNGFWSVIYDNDNSPFLLSSCLLVGENLLGNYTGGTRSTIQNSASNRSIAIGGTMINNGLGKAINSDWSVDSASYGVYSGPYAWAASTFAYP